MKKSRDEVEPGEIFRYTDLGIICIAGPNGSTELTGPTAGRYTRVAVPCDRTVEILEATFEPAPTRFRDLKPGDRFKSDSGTMMRIVDVEGPGGITYRAVSLDTGDVYQFAHTYLDNSPVILLNPSNR